MNQDEKYPAEKLPDFIVIRNLIKERKANYKYIEEMEKVIEKLKSVSVTSEQRGKIKSEEMYQKIKKHNLDLQAQNKKLKQDKMDLLYKLTQCRQHGK